MREGWTYKKLGEVCEVVMGQSPDGDSINEKEGTEFHQGKTCFGERFLTHSTLYTSKPAKYAEANSVLLCVRAPVGFPNITQRRICIGRGLCSLSCKKEITNMFLYYSLLGKQAYFEKNSTGSTFKAISSKIVSNTTIPIPSLSEQQSIVAELDKINELISLKKAQLSDLDSLAQSIFYDMFGDLMVNEKGWEIKKLGEIAQIGDGLHGTPRYDNTGDCYFINGNNLGNGSIVITKDTKKVNEQEKEKYKIEFTNNTLLVSINGSIGKVAFYNNENIILGKSACYIILNEYINKVYIFNVLKNRYFLDYVSNEYTGTTIRNISLKSMRNLPIPLPPLPLQQEFAKRIELIEQQKAQISSTIKDLETLLASRMQYWFD